MKFFLILYSILFDGYFQHAPEKIVPPKLDYYLSSKEKIRIAIFKYNTKQYGYLNFDKRAKPTSLSAYEINTIEKLIKQRVSIFNRESKIRYGESGLIKFPEKYFKQMVPVLNPNGEKEVWVYCSCEVMDGYWKKGIGIVMDGGSCYFRLKINLTKGIVTMFGTNGDA